MIEHRLRTASLDPVRTFGGKNLDQCWAQNDQNYFGGLSNICKIEYWLAIWQSKKFSKSEDPVQCALPWIKHCSHIRLHSIEFVLHPSFCESSCVRWMNSMATLWQHTFELISIYGWSWPRSMLNLIRHYEFDDYQTWGCTHAYTAVYLKEKVALEEHP